MRNPPGLPLSLLLFALAAAPVRAQAVLSLTGYTLAGPTPTTVVASQPAGYHNASDVREPYLYWTPAYPERVRGAAAPTVLICPGGGYHVLAFEKEGLEVARRLAARGISTAVLMSRLPATEPDAPFPRLVALEDGRAALALLRARAGTLGIDTARLGVMGFSAGGHLAMLLSTLDDPAERPRASVLVYPVITMDTAFTHGGSAAALLGPDPTDSVRRRFSGEARADARTPPTYLVHATDDGGVPVRNTLAYAGALNAAGVPFALDVFPQGGHGFGLYAPGVGEGWPARLDAWLEGLGW